MGVTRGSEPGRAGKPQDWGKRAERKYTKKLMKRERYPTPAQVNKLVAMVKDSRKDGTYNKRDSKVLKKFVKQLEGNKATDKWGYPEFDSTMELYDYRSKINELRKDSRWKNVKGVAPSSNPAHPLDTVGGIVNDAVNEAIKNGHGAKPAKGSSSRPPVGGGKKGSKGYRNDKGSKGYSAPTDPFSGGMSYYGLGSPPANVDNFSRQAKATVQQEINRQVKDLLNQINQQKNAKQYDVGKINALYDRSVGDLNYVFGEADDFIKGRNGAIQDRYNNTAELLRGQFGDFQQGQAQTVAQNRAAAANELQRLGIQQTGLGSFDADAANTSALAGVNQQNMLGNLATQAAGAGEIGSLLRSMSAASLASAKGRANNERQESLGDARQEYLQYFNDQLNRINDVRAQRPQMVTELSSALQNNSFQQWMDMQQAQFNNQLATNKFNLDVAKLNSSNMWKQAAQNQAAAEARWKKRLSKAERDAAQMADQTLGAAEDVLGSIFG